MNKFLIRNIILIFFLGFQLSFFCCELSAQNINVTETRVRAELAKRGISEAEMMAALKENGIEVEDLKDLTPSQLLELERIVADLELSKRVPNEALPITEPVDKQEFLEVPSQMEAEESLDEVIEQLEEEVPEEEIPPIYGHDFFINKDLGIFEKTSEVKAPSSYILGSGDKIVVSIWGLSQAEFAFEIDEEGYIEHENRRIFLGGLKLSDAILKLRSWFSRYYRFGSGEFDVAISFSRTINVNVQGEVRNPGGYSLSAVNNAFNALVAAEGPTRIGSLRDILLVRKAGEVESLDFYQYLKNPLEANNASLKEGDVLVIPVAKKLVQIVGAVNRPMIYELKEEDSLTDLIELSGGFTSNANKQFLQVESTSEKERIIVDVSRSEFDQFELNNGDRVTISSIANEAENYVNISGAVYTSGKFERKPGETVESLLLKSELKPSARKDLAFLKREESNGNVLYIKINIEPASSDLKIDLQNKDELIVFDLARYVDNQRFAVSGAVRNPGSFTYGFDQDIKIKDAIELAGGLRRDASGYAIIHTIDPLNPKVKQYERISLIDAYENSDQYTLSALDSVEVFSNALFDELSTVSIQGAVNNPGSFQFGQGMELADILTMAGGFQLAAATNKIEISRLVIEENEPTKTVIANLSVNRDLDSSDPNMNFKLQPYDEVRVRYVPEFELQKQVRLNGEVKFPGNYSLIKDNETIKDVIERAGGITKEAFPPGARLYRNSEEVGYIILKLDEVLRKGNSRFNFSLQDGDVIEIPKLKEFVTILGATNARDLYVDDILGNQNEINVPFHRGKNASFYIKEYAGGVAKNGNKNEVYVENPNGELSKVRNFGLFKLYPEVEKGSKIIVGLKEIKTPEEREKEKIDWNQVLNDSVAQAMSVLTLLLLIERL